MRTTVLGSAARRVAVIGATAALGLLGAAPAIAEPITTDATCDPGPIEPTNVQINLADTTLSGYQIVEADFSGSIPNGYCSSATLTIQLPDLLRTDNRTLEIYDASNELMGHAAVTGGYGETAVITFEPNYLETHQNVTIHGTFLAGFSEHSQPNSSYQLEWEVGSTVVTTPVTTNPCPDCSGPLTEGTKWASMGEANEWVDFGFVSVQTQAAGEVITVTDVLGDGQELDCSSLGAGYGTTRGVWGGVIWDASLPIEVTDCTESGFTATVVATAAGQYIVVSGRAAVTEVLESYTNVGTITQAGVPTEVDASADWIAASIGGDGNAIGPKIDIEKWSSEGAPAYDDAGNVANEGAEGDHDAAPGKELDPLKAETITFTVSNNGEEALVNVAVTDELTSGTGTITGLTCTFPGGATGTEWDGPFAVGDQFTCTGTLPALGASAAHADTATVTAVGQYTQTPVTDSDVWHGFTGPGQTGNEIPGPTPPAPTPPAPVNNQVPGPTPPQATSKPVLAVTGADAAPLAGLAALMLVGGGLALLAGRRRREV